nr:uncharacterized protein LOC108944570 [Nicotiana tomentosiformis]
MKTLRRYEEASGQEINKDKSFYLASNYIHDSRHNMIQRLTCYRYQSFPFKYLGCPIYSGRKKICYYTDIARNVMNKIRGWQGHVLSPGGRATIIKHVLKSQILHILAIVTPPKTILEQLDSYFSNFFLEKSEKKNKYHWSSLRNLCYPTDEGGVGFKNLTNLCKTFSTKRWWMFRVANNIWVKFMRAKNSPRSHPVSKIGLGPLGAYINGNRKPDNMKIRDCIKDEAWDINTITSLVPNNLLNHIKHIPISDKHINDTPVWTETSNGTFTCSSAFNSISKRRDMDNMWKDVWKKNVQFKMSFFLWRAIKGPLGIKVGCHSIAYTLKQWSNFQNKNDIQRILCQVYMKKRGATVDMKWQWHKICSYMEDFRPRITSTPVIWNKSPEGLLKINTDGSSNITKRNAGIGGVVRNIN